MKKWSVLILLIFILALALMAGCGASPKKMRPAAPGTPTVTSADGQLTVSWTAVTGATGYEVYYNAFNSGDTAFIVSGDVNNADTTCIITGLTNGTPYYVWVKAKNSVGTSDFSPAGSGTPVGATTSPAAPSAPTVIPGDTQLTVSWTAVSGASKYAVYYYDANSSGSAYCWDYNITGLTSTITGLTNGTPYWVWVKARNSAGTSDFSPIGNGTPFAAPTMPTLTAGNSIINLNWPTVPGADYYEVWYNTVNNSATATKFNEINDTDTFCNITGVTNGQTYHVWLKAKKYAGAASAFSAPASVVPFADPLATVYNAGYYASTPCYWAGNARYDLPYNEDYYAVASSVFVSGGTVYTAGLYNIGYGNVACYWSNTTEHDVYGNGTISASATGIYIAGTSVYVCGNSAANGSAHYWTGSSDYVLPGNSTNGIANVTSIFVSGGAVYTAGYYFENSKNNPCYWVGTTKHELGDGSYEGYATGIYVSGTTVYTSGYYWAGKWLPCYWTGSTRTDLPIQGINEGKAFSIFVDNGIVYTGGYWATNTGYGYTPCYWADTVRHDLAGDLEGWNECVNSIYVVNDVVYCGGYYQTGISNSYNAPCYWVGASKHDLPVGGGSDGRVESIFVQ